jgi:hypothetical protein
MLKIIPVLVLLGGSMAATAVAAAPAALKCTGADMGPHFMYLWVDTEANTVDIGRVDTMTAASSGVKAQVSEGEIAWDVASAGGDMYHYTLNRKTGALGVTAANYESGQVTCKPATP